MHFPFKRHASEDNNVSLPSSIPLAPNQPTPLHPHAHSSIQQCLAIPEILERIFSFISDKTMTNTVIRVCREWHTIGRTRMYREYRWDKGWDKGWGREAEKDQELLKLSKAGLLIWRQDNISNADHNWAPSMNLREIELFGAYIMMPVFNHRFPLPPTLKSIKLIGTERNLFCFNLMPRAFPHLEILHIEKLDSIPNEACMIKSYGWLDQVTMLRSLVLRFVCLSQDVLQMLLNESPFLQDLHLIDTVTRGNAHWDYTELFSSVTNSLKSFHLSMRNELLVDEVLVQMIMVCPESQNRTFWSYQLTPTVIRILDEQYTFLTTLDILWHQYPKCSSNGWYYFKEEAEIAITAGTLHELLCTAPILRHLRVLKAPYIVQNMDIYHRSTMNPDVGALHATYRKQWDMFQPGIWICRNLDTLHLQVHGHGPYPANVYTLTRILYGYISVVCPRLTELRLESAEMCSLNPQNDTPAYILIDLFAGLCLLSRLQFLERLIVMADGSEKHAPASLNWLCKAGRTLEYKRQRQTVAKGWQSVLEAEVRLEPARHSLMTRGKDKQQDGNDSLPRTLGSENVETMQQLKDLGLLVDMTNQIQLMDSDGYQTLPYLELLSLGKTMERSPEEEIRSRCKQSFLKYYVKG
ncbi:hypothetical protein FBU30_005261 [Linnemannia zychae]|nr:hypothetical protein FBU30_005261 [Linnemannia zychae]